MEMLSHCPREIVLNAPSTVAVPPYVLFPQQANKRNYILDIIPVVFQIGLSPQHLPPNQTYDNLWCGGYTE